MVRAARDEEFEVSVRGNRASLVRFARTLAAGDAHLAEDLVQAARPRLPRQADRRAPPDDIVTM